MTEEERDRLELRKADARSRCRETYATIQQLKHILANYYKDYYHWRERYLEADRELAMEEKLRIVSGEKRKKKVPELTVKLTKEQIIAIAEELGILEELNFD